MMYPWLVQYECMWFVGWHRPLRCNRSGRQLVFDAYADIWINALLVLAAMPRMNLAPLVPEVRGSNMLLINISLCTQRGVCVCVLGCWWY